jgi:hypothetical protein
LPDPAAADATVQDAVSMGAGVRRDRAFVSGHHPRAPDGSLARPLGRVGTEILDEVMCGVGRTGTVHAWEQEGVTPDIQVVANCLSDGYQPIGGILIAGRIVHALADGYGGFLHG